MKVINGQPLKFRKDNFETFVCCDCGLTHKVVFNKNVIMIAYRDDYLTKKNAKPKK
ncbi:hypothetical protein CCP1ISM_50018 [Azospirillaceae bacterium]